MKEGQYAYIMLHGVKSHKTVIVSFCNYYYKMSK
jgi:hypothetical protein